MLTNARRTMLECRDSLDHVHKVLREIPTEAWRKFRDLDLDHRVPIEKKRGIRAGVVWAYMQDEASHRLDLPGIRSFEAYDSVSYVINEAVVVRMKKVDADKLSRNYPTDRARDYNSLIEIPGISASATRVDLGYELNDVETEIDAVWMVHRHGDERVWYYEIPVDGIVIIDFNKDARARETERGYRFGINDAQLELFQATDDESIG